MNEPIVFERFLQRFRFFIRSTNALFGYVYPDENVFNDNLAVAPVLGTIKDEQLCNSFIEPIRQRLLQLRIAGKNQSVTLSSYAAKDSSAEWFAAILTKDLVFPSSLAVVYPYITPQESVRTLAFCELIFSNFGVAKMWKPWN